MIPTINLLEEELKEIEYASNTYKIENTVVYDTIDKTIVDKGICGDNVKWELYQNNVLYIKGDGSMYNYEYKTSPFADNDKIKIVIIKKGVTDIGSYAFKNCQNLTSVTLPDGMLHIWEGAFYRCSNLKSILIPDSLIHIWTGAFYECNKLTDVYYRGTATQWNKIVLGGVNDVVLNATKHYQCSSDVINDSASIHPNPTCSDYLDRINGYVDDIDAIKQAIYLILSIERYQHIIYSWDYGVELLDLYGKPLPYVMADLPRRITEALTQDDRIEDVTDFEFERNGKRLHTTFTVITNAGNIPTDLEVEI
jgi:hypothetical protein